MAVLIEAITLVIPKLVLDLSWPGGSDAFLDGTLKLDRPPRFVCDGDPHLANVSFYDPDHASPVHRMLIEGGLIEVDDRQFVDFAFVDQRYGPAMPCPWLEWKRHPDGFTFAWKAGTDPGDMAAPDDWTAERSRSMTRTDARDTGRLFKLAEEEEFETWLDLLTGQIHEGLKNDR